MSQVKYNSPGVTVNDAGVIPRLNRNIISTPTVIVGTSHMGPAYVPEGFSKTVEFQDLFGIPNISGSIVSSDKRFTDYGALAVQECINNGSSATFIRVLGAGNCKKRIETGTTAGDVVNAGFTVGEEQPDQANFSGSLSKNPYANEGGVLGRTYFLGCFMSESAGSNVFNAAGLQGTGSVNGIGINTSVPIIRGILMAPSGVILRLSSSAVAYDSSGPSSTQIASETSAKGTTIGSIDLLSAGDKSQQFIMLLNGHKGSDDYPNVITASLDMQSPFYITRVFNMTASLIQRAGHYLASHWDIHPAVATLTGVGVVSSGAGAPSDSSRVFSTERSVFLLTSSLQRDVGSSTVPNFEGFRDRFSHASTPWIISQKIHGKYVNLFKLHSLHDGEQHKNYKIVIHDITPPSDEKSSRFGTFSISIRDINDFDETSKSLQTFANVDLNPSSDMFISKVIGDINKYFDFDRPDDDQRLVVEGNYPNNSVYVRVEVSDEVLNNKISNNTLPMGFRGISHIVTSGSSVLAPLGGQDSSALLNSYFLRNLVTPPLPLCNNIFVVNNSKKEPSSNRRWGIKFDHIINQEKQNNFKHIDESILSFIKHYPSHSTVNVNFSVSNNHGTSDTPQLGIIDADRFCNNLFTLENIKVLTGSINDSNNTITDNWQYASYVRDGNISINDSEKTRRVSVDDLKNPINRTFLSFQTMLCGGFDGTNIFDLNESNFTNLAVIADMNDQKRGKQSASTTAAYLKVLEMLRSPTVTDMQILAIPGIRSPAVTDEAIDVAESRMDCLYILDIEQIGKNDEQVQISEIIAYDEQFKPDLQKTIRNFDDRALNTSYAAGYYPDVELEIDAPTYKINSIIVPPSVAVVGGLAANDSLGNVWFSPSGNSRGSLRKVISTTVSLSKSDIDSLYKSNINFLYAPSNVGGQGTGVIIGGQKTLNRSSSSLSRVNVRRLLIDIRSRVRNVALNILFDSDRETATARFISDVSVILQRISSASGLDDFKVEVDSSQNDIDNQTFKGRIYIRPKKSIDYLSLDFIVSNNLQSEI
ncbi:MAG: hypothetical protein EBU90_05100 [Proteobacteria bacterium]|nr:hypothetical protein [Pseudomonadota bacterium]